MLRNASISTRIFLLTAAMSAVVAGIGWQGLSALSTAHDRLTATIASSRAQVSAVDVARSAQVYFKRQVQEWKDILLRGMDAEEFAHYERNFTAAEAKSQSELVQLRELLQKMGGSVVPVDMLLRTHTELGQRYREALRHYDRAQADSPHVVDRLVKGMDRPATEAFDALVLQMNESARRPTRRWCARRRSWRWRRPSRCRCSCRG
jgi:hypothetical protein